jgi:hypothetical protein
MTIVPIGNLTLQVPQSSSKEFILELVEEVRTLILEVVGRLLEESLEAEMERF